MVKPVFYDAGRRRWRRLRALLDLLGVVITLVAVVFVYSVWRFGQLPELKFAGQRRPYHALKEAERNSRAVPHQVSRKLRQARNQPGGAAAVSGEGLRAAYYVQWDAGSLASLREYQAQIDLLFPEWLHVLTPDGRIQAVTGENQLFDLVRDGRFHAPDDKVMPMLKAEKSETDVLPLVNNFNPVTKQWLSNIGDFLNDPQARRHFRDQLQPLFASEKYSGLSLDFEEIPLAAQPGFQALIAELAADFHQHGLKLYVNVPVDDRDYDLEAMAKHADGLIMMNYDQHNSGTAAGPVAGQEWFVKNLREALKTVPASKLICAVGNYGYDWVTETRRRGAKPVVVNSSTVQEAWLNTRESEEEVEFDEDSLNPHVSFLEGDKLRHDVWFLDAVSAYDQMRAANQLGINAFALWRLGSEDRSLWAIWDDPSAADAASRLRVVPSGQDVDLEGRGEVLYIEQRPVDGVRTVGVDGDSGLITSETMTSLPLPYRIAQYGYQEKLIALSFDDGPDPTFTPQVLDVLQRENVKGTFFLIGLSAENHPQLLQRVFDEGHEIGNHTFTHPDISSISRRYMEIELNLTERLLGSRLGVKPLYFRPPYSIDQEPDTAEQVRPLEIVQDRGYITVGNKIDPGDWRESPLRTAEEITADVVAQLGRGSIVLLHDGGGDRRETVRALPMIIRELRQRGYRLVPVSELMGKTRAEVMPPLAPNERFTATINSFAFWIFGTLTFGIAAIFFVGDFLMTGRLLFVGIGAAVDRFFRRGPPASGGGYAPEVAVLVPAFNEEMVIERTVRSVLHSTYPSLRVIVVDDGSTDRTFEVVRQAFAAEMASGKLLLLTKPNSGKASAANFGLQQVTQELFVAIDADTVIHPQAIALMVPHFADPRIGAIAGNAKVGNRVNVWTRWQALEYITSQNFERRALNTLGAVSVVPGAIGAWRTAAVREVGLYPHDTVAEDADLTMSLLQRGYKIHYEDRALAFTEAPMTARGLMRQRFRWSFGILQAVWKHRGAFWRGGSLGWVALPNIVIFQILLPLVSPFIDLMFLVGALSFLFDRHFHPETANGASFARLAMFFAIFLIIDFIAATLAFLLERPEARSPRDRWLLGQVWLQRFAYRQLFSIVLFKTLKRAIDGRSFNWDKIERTASLTHAG